MVILNLEVGWQLIISEIDRVKSFIEMIWEMKGIVLSWKSARIIEFGKSERKENTMIRNKR
jgi:hypothetical protein